MNLNFTHHSFLIVTLSKVINEIIRFFFFFCRCCSKCCPSVPTWKSWHFSDLFMATKGCYCTSLNIQSAQGLSWGWVGMAGPVFKTEIPPQAPVPSPSYPPAPSQTTTRSCLPRLSLWKQCCHIRTEEPGTKEMQVKGERSLWHIQPGRLRFWLQEPGTMPLGLKESRQAGHPQRPVSGLSGKQGAWWSIPAWSKPLGTHLSSVKTNLSPHECRQERLIMKSRPCFWNLPS